MTDTFTALCQTLNVHPNHKGEAWTACPFCHKDEGERKATHFSFSERGYKCFVCDAKGSLPELARRYQLGDISPVVMSAPKEPAKPRNWQLNPEAWICSYTAALDRVEAWQKYRPFSLDTIHQYRLGVGVLPSCACQHKRLIVPIYEAGQVVALRGRALSCDCAKWISAAGSKAALINADKLHEGATVFLVENLADSLLLMQENPGIIALASGGVNWREEWTELVAKNKPESVIIAFDNDLAGCPNKETYDRLTREWRQQHPQGEPPKPRGPQVANDLLVAGVRDVSLWQWEPGTPAKADIGWLLMQGRGE